MAGRCLSKCASACGKWADSIPAAGLLGVRGRVDEQVHACAKGLLLAGCLVHGHVVLGLNAQVDASLGKSDRQCGAGHYCASMYRPNESNCMRDVCRCNRGVTRGISESVQRIGVAECDVLRVLGVWRVATVQVRKADRPRPQKS